MSDKEHLHDPSTSPTIEVRVYRGTSLLHNEICETEADAAAVVVHWEERPGVECEVRDLSASPVDFTASEVLLDDASADYPFGEPTL